MSDFTPTFDHDDDGPSSDDMTLDFSGVQSATFVAKPVGWYLCAITDWEEVEVGPTAKKLPVGTKGTNWEFTIQDGEYESKKLWTRHYHHPTTLPFLKGMLKCLDEFTEEELNGALNINEIRERALGCDLLVKNTHRTYEGEKRDNVAGFKNKSEYKGAKTSDSLMP